MTDHKVTRFGRSRAGDGWAGRPLSIDGGTRTALRELSARQRDVLRFLTSHYVTRGNAPTIREIANALELSSTNGVAQHLDALELKGYIRRVPYRARGIEILVDSALPDVEEL